LSFSLRFTGAHRDGLLCHLRAMNTTASLLGALVVGLALGACRGSTENSQGNGASSGGASQRTYTVKLHRPARVGMRRREAHVGESNERRQSTVNGAETTVDERRTRVEFNALSEVLAVNSVFKPTRLRYTVERFEATAGQEQTASLEAGTVVEVSLAEESAATTITVAGVAVSEPVRKAFDAVISLTVSLETDDSVFGTAQPRAIGATWAASVEPLRQRMGEGPLEIPSDGMSASVTLFGVVEREAGQPLLDVRGEATIARARLRQVPEGFTSMTLDMQMRMRSLLPVHSPDAPPVLSESSMDSTARGEGSVQGATIALDMRSHSERHSTFVTLP
jgi:hypothetical protein